MSKRKGLSAEEKRTRMLQIFYERKEFFQLKELEKIAPKEKGIISQSVKDVVQSLCDDGLIDSEKIGTSMYFWAFPSKATHTRKKKLDSLVEEFNTKSQKLREVMQAIEHEKKGREQIPEREQILQALEHLRDEENNLLSEIQKYKDCDPEVLDNLRKQTQVGVEAANRWTDNIFALKSWCKKKFFIEENTLNKQFGIDPELDYIN